MHTIDEKKLEAATALFLEGLGLDLSDQHLIDTPRRVAKAWKHQFGAGYEIDPHAILNVEFSDSYDNMILVDKIPVMSHCIHHMVPFVGTASVAYIPAEKRITGLSKLARIVNAYAQRLQIQEQLTRQIADAIQQVLRPKGVAVVIRAEHMCMSHRGVRATGSATTTSCMLGCFLTERETRAEFFSLCK